MARWLVKEEPTHYSFDDLVRDGRTPWTGVHNPLAQRYLRAMRPRDPVFYYHTGDERAVVGIAQVVSEPRPDPADARRAFMVDLAPMRPLRRPVPLAEIRADPEMSRIALVRIPRLSVQPVTVAQWKRINAASRRLSP